MTITLIILTITAGIELALYAKLIGRRPLAGLFARSTRTITRI